MLFWLSGGTQHQMSIYSLGDRGCWPYQGFWIAPVAVCAGLGKNNGVCLISVFRRKPVPAPCWALFMFTCCSRGWARTLQVGGNTVVLPRWGHGPPTVKERWLFPLWFAFWCYGFGRKAECEKTASFRGGLSSPSLVTAGQVTHLRFVTPQRHGIVFVQRKHHSWGTEEERN